MSRRRLLIQLSSYFKTRCSALIPNTSEIESMINHESASCDISSIFVTQKAVIIELEERQDSVLCTPIFAPIIFSITS